MMGIVIRVQAALRSIAFLDSTVVHPTLLYTPDAEHERYYEI